MQNRTGCRKEVAVWGHRVRAQPQAGIIGLCLLTLLLGLSHFLLLKCGCSGKDYHWLLPTQVEMDEKRGSILASAWGGWGPLCILEWVGLQASFEVPTSLYIFRILLSILSPICSLLTVFSCNGEGLSQVASAGPKAQEHWFLDCSHPPNATNQILMGTPGVKRIARTSLELSPCHLAWSLHGSVSFLGKLSIIRECILWSCPKEQRNGLMLNALNRAGMELSCWAFGLTLCCNLSTLQSWGNRLFIHLAFYTFWILSLSLSLLSPAFSPQHSHWVWFDTSLPLPFLSTPKF